MHTSTLAEREFRKKQVMKLVAGLAIALAVTIVVFLSSKAVANTNAVTQETGGVVNPPSVNTRNGSATETMNNYRTGTMPPTMESRAGLVSGTNSVTGTRSTMGTGTRTTNTGARMITNVRSTGTVSGTGTVSSTR